MSNFIHPSSPTTACLFCYHHVVAVYYQPTPHDVTSEVVVGITEVCHSQNLHVVSVSYLSNDSQIHILPGSGLMQLRA